MPSAPIANTPYRLWPDTQHQASAAIPPTFRYENQQHSPSQLFNTTQTDQRTTIHYYSTALLELDQALSALKNKVPNTVRSTWQQFILDELMATRLNALYFEHSDATRHYVQQGHLCCQEDSNVGSLAFLYHTIQQLLQPYRTHIRPLKPLEAPVDDVVYIGHSHLDKARLNAFVPKRYFGIGIDIFCKEPLARHDNEQILERIETHIIPLLNQQAQPIRIVLTARYIERTDQAQLPTTLNHQYLMKKTQSLTTWECSL